MERKVKTIIALFLSVLTVLSVGLLFGCSSCGEQSVYEAEEFDINFSEKTVKVGESFILTVDNAKYKDYVLFASDNNGVAIVSAKGMVTGVAEGQAKITATVGEKQKVCVVTVLKSEQKESGYTVSLSNSALSLSCGENTTIKATVRSGSEIIEDMFVLWQSSDEGVLETVVDETDKNSVKITAKKSTDKEPPYKVFVTATLGKFEAKCEVTITERIDIVFDCETEEETLTACRNLQLPLGGEGKISVSVYKNDVKADGANVAVSCSDNKIALIDGDRISGVGIGECVLTAIFEGYKGKLYVEVFERIIETEYEKQFIKADGDALIELSELTVNGIAVGLNAGDVVSVLKASDRSEMSFEKDAVNNTLTLSAQEMPNGENEYYICALTAKYSVKIITVTRLIDSIEDFNALISDIYGCLPENPEMNTFYYYDGYYVLTADIDFAGTAPTSNYYWTVFSGVLDGNGHEIKNVVATNPIFNVLKGTVKNMAFINVSVTSQYAGVICSELTGTVENCFVSGTVSGTVAQGGICQAVRTSGVIKNCIVDVIITGEGAKGTLSYSNVGDITDVYGICAEVQRCDASTGAEIAKVGMYATRGEFISAVTMLSADKGWAEFWSIENGKLYFNGNDLFKSEVDKTEQGGLYNLSLQSTENYVLDLTKLDENIGQVSSVKIAGQEINGFTQNGKSLTIPNAQIKGVMVGGEKLTEIIAANAGNNSLYRFYLTVVTAEISDKAQFNAFINDINGCLPNNAEANKFYYYDGYYVLTADIDFAGTAPTSNNYWAVFSGVLDGRGHAIKNVSASSPIFKVLKGTVKNTAFINVSVTTDVAGGICSELTGTVANCFVSGTVSGTVAQGGICQAVRATGIIKNCIVDVSINGTATAKGTISYSNAGNITNVYGICAEVQRRDASSAADIAKVGMYADRNDFIANVTDLPADKGWGEFWSIENGRLYFNGVDLFDEAASVKIYNVYPNVVKGYLELTDENEIAEYLYTHKNDWKTPEYVKPVILTWQGTGETYQVVIAYDDKYENVARIINATSNTLAVYNLVPSVYYYKVIANDTDIIAQDSFELDGELRMIYLGNNNMNMRDEGGYTGEFGKVNYELLYRSADITVLSSGGTSVGILVDELGIKTEIDLRLPYDDDLSGKTSPSEEITRYNLGIRQMDYMFPDLNSGRPFNQQYADNLKKIIRLMGDESNYPTVFHCAAGADRTGTIGLIVGGLLGLDYETLVKDYELTSFYRGSRWRSAINEENGEYSFDPSGVMRDDSSNLATFDKVYRHILSEYGTGNGKFSTAVENYLMTVAGLTENDIENVREILIEDYVRGVSERYSSDAFDNGFDLGNE